MGKMITDEMLNEFAVVGTYDELVPKIRERYAGVLTTLDFGFGMRGPADQDRLNDMVKQLESI